MQVQIYHFNQKVVKGKLVHDIVATHLGYVEVINGNTELDRDWDDKEEEWEEYLSYDERTGLSSCISEWKPSGCFYDENGTCNSGEIFVCEDDFYDSEYKDVAYMEYLLSPEMFRQYKQYQ